MASGLVTSIGSGCSLATATSSTKTVTITARTAGYAGDFITQFGTATQFNTFYIYITNTVLGQGPNYVSGITVTSASKAWNLAGLKCALVVSGCQKPTALIFQIEAPPNPLLDPFQGNVSDYLLKTDEGATIAAVSPGKRPRYPTPL